MCIIRWNSCSREKVNLFYFRFTDILDICESFSLPLSISLSVRFLSTWFEKSFDDNLFGEMLDMINYNANFERFIYDFNLRSYCL